MKNSRRLILAAVCLTFAFCVSAGMPNPQDPVKAAPDNFKVLLENDQVRVLDFHGKAGEKIPMHSHPANVTYLVSGGGKTTFTGPDGKTTERDAKVGTATWSDAETHSSVSSGVVHAIIIELKK